MLKLRLVPLMGLILAAGVGFTQAQDTKKDDKKEPAKETKAEPAKDTKAEPAKDAKKEPAKDTKTEPAKAPSADGKVDFSWKMEKDKSFYQETTTKTTQSIKVMGMDVNQTQAQTFYFKWTPLSSDAGKWKVKQTIEGLKMDIDIAGNPIKFDSETSAPQGSNTQLSDFFKSLKNSEFTLTLSDKYKVEKIEGKEDFLKRLGTANQQMETLLKTILTDEALKQMADPTFGFVPPEAKAKGDTWKSTTTVNLGPIGIYDNNYTYTYKSKDGDLNTIEVVSEVVYKAPTDNGAGLPFKIKAADLKTKDKTPGKIVYNSKTGRVDSAEMVLKLAGNLSVEIGGTTTTVELQQDQTTSVKTADKTFLPEKK